MKRKVEAGAPKTVKPSMTLAQLMQRFKTEDDCKAFLRDMRWPDGVVRCPRCGSDKVYALKARPFNWQCELCAEGRSYRFSVLKGTIFENTKYPLRTWFQVAYLMCQSKKGMSALQIHRQIGSGDYRTAWFMCHRLRAAMQNETFTKLVGEVEVDESYVGGKDANRHASKKRGHEDHGGKVTVIGAISRKGNVVAKMIEHADAKTLQKFVRETVSNKVSLLSTDEHLGYQGLGRGGHGRFGYPHETVNHSADEYFRVGHIGGGEVIGAIHTNTIENFWSLLKRGIVGTYHKVGKRYLPLYLNEFAFRYNERQNPEIFEALIRTA
jgi:transposase-like protein